MKNQMPQPNNLFYHLQLQVVLMQQVYPFVLGPRFLQILNYHAIFIKILLIFIFINYLDHSFIVININIYYHIQLYNT